MPRKKKAIVIQDGEGFMDFVNSVKKAHQYVKDKKLLSKGADIVRHVSGTVGKTFDNDMARNIEKKAADSSAFLKKQGYGKKRKVIKM